MPKSDNSSRLSRRDWLRLSGLGLFAAGCPNLLTAQTSDQPGTTQPHPAQSVQPPKETGMTHVVITPENPALVRDRVKCTRCGQCLDYCNRYNMVQGHRSSEGRLSCIYCGQCSIRCETRSITERSAVAELQAALDDPEKIVAVTTAPAIRASLGEMFSLPPELNVEGGVVAALRALGCDYVFDATFGADLCVMEEATELLRRLEQKPEWPLFTSCCPSWVRFAELFTPQLLPHISTTKSPILMQGAMIKGYFAQKNHIDPKKIFHVALTPCTAKKAEIQTPGSNVDLVLTTREMGLMLREKNIDLASPAPLHTGTNGPNGANYDGLLGRGSGGGLAFGRSGGVMESALRTAYFLKYKKNAPLTKTVEIRGAVRTVNWVNPMPLGRIAGVRQDTVGFDDSGELQLRIAVVETTGSVRGLLDAMEHDGERFDFVEVMACPGGCLGGGGQPYPTELGSVRNLVDARKIGLQSGIDRSKIRLCHENVDVTLAYKDFLGGGPGSEKAATLLHR